MKSLSAYIEPFDTFLRIEDASRRTRATNWQAAIGLQDVDRLRPSAYLLETAMRHVKGEISLQECHRLIDSERLRVTESASREKEADKASVNIVSLLTSGVLNLSAAGFITLHRQIFNGVFPDAGTLRPFEITKREWVLEGDTVCYLNSEDLYRALDWDISKEKKFSYRNLSEDEKIEHIAGFLSNLWQIHPFSEGNTRTTAIFAIQYLRSLGFQVDTKVFALYARYFRNALVRANYRNVAKGIDYEFKPLNRFLRNLLLGESSELRNSDLHIKQEIGNRSKTLKENLS